MKKDYFTKYLALFFIIILFVSCDKEISTSPPEPEPPQGSIQVNSEPEGFKIYLDGRFTGRYTPDSVPFIEEDLHEITLKRNLWKDTSVTLMASAQNPPQVDVDYLSNPSMYGKINFLSNPPGATVFLNDSLLDISTPSILSGLLPGKYKVKLRYEQHRDGEAFLDVKSSSTTSINLALKDTSVWVDYTILNSLLPTNNVTALAVDLDDNIWVGTTDKGIVKIKDAHWELFSTLNTSLPSDRITTIMVDSENTKWVGTEKGLAKFQDPASIVIYNSANSGLSNEIIRALDYDNSSIIWIGTSSGLGKLEGGSITLYDRHYSNMPWSWVNDVKTISTGDVWVAIDSFVTRYDGSTFTIFDPAVYDIPNSKILGMDIDKGGNLWAAFTPQVVKVNGILQTLPGGLGIYNGSTWSSVLISGSNASYPINDLYIDNDDLKWISSSNGLLKFSDLNTSQAYRPNNSGILSQKIRVVVEDSKGTLWIATDSGLAKYKKYLDTD